MISFLHQIGRMSISAVCCVALGERFIWLQLQVMKTRKKSCAGKYLAYISATSEHALGAASTSLLFPNSLVICPY